MTAQEYGYFGYGVSRQDNGLEKAVDWTPFMVLEGSSPSTIAASLTKLEELASMGLDAKNILKNLHPNKRLGITLSKKELALR